MNRITFFTSLVYAELTNWSTKSLRANTGGQFLSMDTISSIPAWVEYTVINKDTVAIFIHESSVTSAVEGFVWWRVLWALQGTFPKQVKVIAACSVEEAPVQPNAVFRTSWNRWNKNVLVQAGVFNISSVKQNKRRIYSKVLSYSCNIVLIDLKGEKNIQNPQ